MPGAFRSKVREIMKQYRSGELKGPAAPSTGGVLPPSEALPKPDFKNKFDAKKYAFETAKAGLSEVPSESFTKKYDAKLAKFTERANKPAPVTPAKEETTKGGGRETNPDRLAKKARRMENRGMMDVYNTKGVKPYVNPDKKKKPKSASGGVAIPTDPTKPEEKK